MAQPFSRTQRALAGQTGRAAFIAWGVAAGVLAAWAMWFVAGEVQVVEVSRSARLQAGGAPDAVVAARAGSVARTTLQLGRAVRAGEVLVELDDRALRAQRDEAAALVAADPARRAALQAERDALAAAAPVQAQAASAAEAAATARAAEAQAQAAFSGEHARRLAAGQAEGGIAEIDVLRQQADARRLQAAQAALAAEPARLALTAATQALEARARRDQIDGALAALDAQTAQARAAVDRLDAELDRLRLRAPVDGTLAEVLPLAAGAHLAEGERVATVVPSGALMLVAEFAPASALGRLRPGQTARWRLDGFPWTQFGSAPATVVRVAGEVREQTLRAELALPPGVTLPMQHGLGGTVEVTLETVSPARLLLRAIGQAGTPPGGAVARAADAPGTP